MVHPFDWLPARYQLIVLVALLIATVYLSFNLGRFDHLLETDVEKRPSLSLQLAWSSERAQQIIDAWTSEQKIIARSQLYSDFVFLALYPLFLSLSCAVASGFVSGPLAALGMTLSWAVLWPCRSMRRKTS